MNNEKETKEKLLLSAKKEFMEKGYSKASLRNICKSAGVTTGALYFFFKDKEDLFATLVEEPLNQLYALMIHHYKEEICNLQKGAHEEGDFSEDLETAKQITHYLYQYYDEFLLILTKSQGSRFENSVDRFVSISEIHYRKMADKMTEEGNLAKLDDYLIHWMSHMQADIFVHMITHESSEKEALKHIDTIIKFLFGGWYEIFSLPEPKK